MTSSEQFLFIVELSLLKAANIRENLWQREDLFLLERFTMGLEKNKIIDSQGLRWYYHRKPINLKLLSLSLNNWIKWIKHLNACLILIRWIARSCLLWLICFCLCDDFRNSWYFVATSIQNFLQQPQMQMKK